MNATNRSKHFQEKGQALLESALVLLVYLAALISVFDFAQILFFHQSLVERTRAAARWGAVSPYDQAKIANVVLYANADGGTKPFLGLTPSNVQDSLLDAGTEEERIRVAIVNYRFFLFSPWIAKSFVKPTVVVQVFPYEYRAP